MFKLMLGHLQALTQHGEIPVAHGGLSTKARDQRVSSRCSRSPETWMTRSWAATSERSVRSSRSSLAGAWLITIAARPCEASRGPVACFPHHSPHCPALLTSEGLLNVDEAACLRGRRPAIAHGGPPGTRARRRPRLQTPGEHHARPSTPVWRFRLRRSGSLRRRPVHDRCGRRAGAQVETSAPRRMEQSAGTLADGHLAAGMDESEQRP
jgi:hypothetical protein